jgi:hypothetical protein
MGILERAEFLLPRTLDHEHLRKKQFGDAELEEARSSASPIKT